LGGRLRRSPDKWTPVRFFSILCLIRALSLRLTTPEQKEDEKLMELVEKYGVGTKKWRQIAEELGTTKNSAKCGM